MAKLKLEKLLERPEDMDIYNRDKFDKYINAKLEDTRTRMIKALENIGVVTKTWTDSLDARIKTGAAITHININTKKLGGYRRGSKIYFNIGDPRMLHYGSIRRNERKGGMFPFEAVAAEIKQMLVDAEVYNREITLKEDRTNRAQTRADCKLQFLREKHRLEEHGSIEITSSDGEVYGLKMNVSGLSQQQLEYLLGVISQE